MSNSVGKTNRDVRRFIRNRLGYKPTAEMVERIGTEIRRTQQEHETQQKIHSEVAKELGRSGTVTPRGQDAHEAARRAVQREIEKRGD